MHLIHRLIASLKRRRLICQRRINIANIRHGRNIARQLRRDMIRHQRLAAI
jgi:hypothetical protein